MLAMASLLELRPPSSLLLMVVEIGSALEVLLLKEHMSSMVFPAGVLSSSNASHVSFISELKEKYLSDIWWLLACLPQYLGSETLLKVRSSMPSFMAQ